MGWVLLFMLSSFLPIITSGSVQDIATEVTEHREFWRKPWSDDPVIQERTRIGIFIVPPLAVLGYGLSAWDWAKDTGRFRFANEGYFERDTKYGGQDKLGHSWSMFTLARASIWALQRTGQSAQTARWQGTLLTTGLGLGIEIGDGFGKSFGFSIEDFVVNMAGIGLGYTLEAIPWLDDFMGFAWEWNPSRKWKEGDLNKKIDLSQDYDGMKFHLVWRLRAIPALRDSFAQYLQLHTGYFARGFVAEDPPLTRRVFVGAALDLSRILYKIDPKSPWTHYPSTFTEYFQLPTVLHPNPTAVNW